MEWDVAAYGRFDDLRVRPALDLLGRVPAREARSVVDLGCGAGAVGRALRARYPAARLIGVDPSVAMRETATASGCYDVVSEGDAASWRADAPPDVIFSNAALHWADDHATLFPALFGRVAPGGVLAVQMPRQHEAPSHTLLQKVAGTLWPDRFPPPAAPRVAAPEVYARLLAPGRATGAATLDVWETVYLQRLQSDATRHPVAAFTASTAARPYLEKLSEPEARVFEDSYDAALWGAYPPEPDGTVWFPFRRLFIVATQP